MNKQYTYDFIRIIIKSSIENVKMSFTNTGYYFTTVYKRLTIDFYFFNKINICVYQKL